MQYDVDSEVGSLFVVDYRVEQAIPVGSDVSIAFSNRGLALVKTA
jgi:iron(III) transport system ATP-binding protein